MRRKKKPAEESQAQPKNKNKKGRVNNATKATDASKTKTQRRAPAHKGIPKVSPKRCVRKSKNEQPVRKGGRHQAVQDVRVRRDCATKIDLEAHKGLAILLADRMVRSYRLPHRRDEIQEEAKWHLFRASQSFRRDKASFSTWAYHVVRNGISAFCAKLNKTGITMTNEDLDLIPSTTSDPHHRMLFQEWLESLSEEAKEVVWVIFNAPAELIGIDKPVIRPKLARGKIRDFLLREIGWSRILVSKSFHELKERISEL